MVAMVTIGVAVVVVMFVARVVITWCIYVVISFMLGRVARIRRISVVIAAILK